MVSWTWLLVEFLVMFLFLLSVRRLAYFRGVSDTYIYHHYGNKDDQRLDKSFNKTKNLVLSILAHESLRNEW